MVIFNAWFLYRRNRKWLNPKAKLVPLRGFQASVASSLIEAHKRKRERRSFESSLTPVQTNLVKPQSTLTDNVRKDGIDHCPDWKEKRECYGQCLDGYTYISCRKCHVWLCFNKNRNCFSSYQFFVCFLWKSVSYKKISYKNCFITTFIDSFFNTSLAPNLIFGLFNQMIYNILLYLQSEIFYSFKTHCCIFATIWRSGFL